MENLIIDPEAKTRIPLIKVPRNNVGNPYFIGKMQFPGILKFEHGASFMVFTAEEKFEELQIGPIDPIRFPKIKDAGGGASLNRGKLTILLRQLRDQNDSIYYVGEAIGPSEIDLRVGIFFTIFTSIPGQEQIQVSKLQVKAKKLDFTRRTNTFDPNHFTQ